MIIEPLVIVSSAGLLLGLGPFLVLLGASRRAVRMGDALAVLDGRDPQQAPAQITDGDDAAINAAFEALKTQSQPVGEEKSSY